MNLTHEQMATIEQEQKQTYFKSTFGFVNEHNGFRPGCIHVLLGSTGCGKSTLARKLALDCCQDQKALLWLSEDPEDVISYQLYKNTARKESLENLKIISELDTFWYKEDGYKELIEQFEDKVIRYDPKIVIIDNITTSSMYQDGIRPEGQDWVSKRLRRFAATMHIPIVILAHTTKGIMENYHRLIGVDDIRGSAIMTNTAQYAYTFQKMYGNGKHFPFIVIHKSRYHEVKNKYFGLIFEKGEYIQDKTIEWKVISEAFTNRDKF